ncbi:LysM peptidoglycan-binding domain-containing protein [Terribacillus saccharophilus]|uniref:LysM peptidoglycan-binding domain-containing protein n=1 Tax=Terribacillus saccharophilus TaxID=361277 RepID=UPI0039824102
MSTNETTPFMFDIQESLSFRADENLQDLIGIALEPDISIQEFEHEISIRGIIELTGEYHPVQDVVEGTAVAVSPGTREMENVNKLETGTNTFFHRFPVEISIPKHRINQLKDVYVTIDNFDYEIPGSNVLELHATVAIFGVQDEKRQVEAQAADQLYNQTAPIEETNSAYAYSEEVAEQLETQARETYQNEQQSLQYYQEEAAETTPEENVPDADAHLFSQEKYAKTDESELYQEKNASEGRDQQAHTFQQESIEAKEAAQVDNESEIRDQQEQQAYVFNQEYKAQEESAPEETLSKAREQQAYDFNQEYTAQEESAPEETVSEAREQQAYAFNQEYTEQGESAPEAPAPEAREQQEQQPYTFTQEYKEQAESAPAPEAREQQEQQAYAFTQEYKEQVELTAEAPAPEAREQQDQHAFGFNQEYKEPAEAASDLLDHDSQQMVHSREQTFPRVNIQAEKETASEVSEEETYKLEDHLAQDADDSAKSRHPEAYFILPDEMEDAYQAADFRQAYEQDEAEYQLDRELPHEERSLEPDFTFTYQAKPAEEAHPEPITFEAPPLLTPEEDDRWKYKESKTFSEFFGNKPVEPTEVPQVNDTAEEIETDDTVYGDITLQAVPINEELQPEELQDALEEETQIAAKEDAAERNDSDDFLVHMFGAREETYTKVRVCIVQERDTLEKIATRYDVPVSSIASSNNLEEESVSEGQLLVIPQKRLKKS